MASTDQCLWREVTIVNELGLHLRSATKLAQTADAAEGSVWLEHENRQADAKDAIDILTLGAAQGDTLRIRIETPDDAPVLETLVGLVADGFGE
jgi:phosphotransferase system HPr (HPr) family protein